MSEKKIVLFLITQPTYKIRRFFDEISMKVGCVVK